MSILQKPNSDEIDFSKDAQAPADEALSKVSGLANELTNLEAQVEARQLELDSLNEQLKAVREYKLPEAMAEVGLSEFKLKNGAKVTVKNYYAGKIDDENRGECFDWLRSNNHDGLIKHEINVAIGKGDDEVAKQIAEFLKTLGMTFSDKESVHYQTLAGFIREQVEGGADFPMDLFKAFIGRKAKVTQPK
jgi:hypothetical protein